MFRMFPLPSLLNNVVRAVILLAAVAMESAVAAQSRSTNAVLWLFLSVKQWNNQTIKQSKYHTTKKSKNQTIKQSNKQTSEQSNNQRMKQSNDPTSKRSKHRLGSFALRAVNWLGSQRFVNCGRRDSTPPLLFSNLLIYKTNTLSACQGAMARFARP